MSLRIAMYHCRLIEPGSKPGGVQVFVDRLADALSGRGHDVTVFTYSRITEPRPYRVVSIRPAAGATHHFVRQYVAPWLMNVRPFGSRFDVAHLHGDDWFYLRRRLPTVRTFYGSALLEAMNATSGRRRINQSVLFGLEQISRRRADAVYGIGFDSELLYRADGRLTCGVPAPSGPPEPAEQPAIMFIGTWEGRKRGRWLHEVFQREVRPRVPGAQLWLVSDRADVGDGATWLGSPTDEELSERLRRAWAFCLPSTYEGFGIPYLEAMTHGVPVVATRNPGSLELLDGGRAGELVEDAGVGDALVRLLTDRERREQLRAAGYARAEQYRWDAVLDDYEAAYALAMQRFGNGTSS